MDGIEEIKESLSSLGDSPIIEWLIKLIEFIFKVVSEQSGD